MIFPKKISRVHFFTTFSLDANQSNQLTTARRRGEPKEKKNRGRENRIKMAKPMKPLHFGGPSICSRKFHSRLLSYRLTLLPKYTRYVSSSRGIGRFRARHWIGHCLPWCLLIAHQMNGTLWHYSRSTFRTCIRHCTDNSFPIETFR